MKTVFLLILLSLLMACSSSSLGELNKPYQGWQEGEMDIHHIYTGRGESSFHIFPDGTSMLIDAGDWDPQDYENMCELLPDSSCRSGEWIARYIMRVNPFANQVDYLVLSHFHSDHTGDCTNDAIRTSGRNPDYVLTGIAEVGEYIRFEKVIDRGWPDYQYPLPINDPDVDNYRAFVSWKTKQDGLQPENFDVGSADQFILLNEKEKYGNSFRIQNLAANGRIWTGSKKNTKDYYELHPLNITNPQNENSKSIGMRISYGPFSYYTAGDLSGFLLDREANPIDLEEEIARICGAVDVCKVNHHAYKDAMTEGFIKNIEASVYIIPVWDYEHMQPVVMERMASHLLYPTDRMIFPTRFPHTLRKKYQEERWMKSVCEMDGHIVVKVFDKGHKYKIYVLSANCENQIVKSIYGPYDSKSPFRQ